MVSLTPRTGGQFCAVAVESSGCEHGRPLPGLNAGMSSGWLLPFRDGMLRYVFIILTAPCTIPHRPGKQYRCLQDLFQFSQLYCTGLPGLPPGSLPPQAVQPARTGHGGVTTEVALLVNFKENRSCKLPEDRLLLLKEAPLGAKSFLRTNAALVIAVSFVWHWSVGTIPLYVGCCRAL